MRQGWIRVDVYLSPEILAGIEQIQKTYGFQKQPTVRMLIIRGLTQWKKEIENVSQQG